MNIIKYCLIKTGFTINDPCILILIISTHKHPTSGFELTLNITPCLSKADHWVSYNGYKVVRGSLTLRIVMNTVVN